MTYKSIIAAAIVWMIALPIPAFAHVEEGQAAGFITGLQHPWSGLDHVLAMIAVGLWGAVLGPPQRLLLLDSISSLDLLVKFPLATERFSGWGPIPLPFWQLQ